MSSSERRGLSVAALIERAGVAIPEDAIIAIGTTDGEIGDTTLGKFLPFPGYDVATGEDGRPATSADAIVALERARTAGARFLVLPAPTNGWLDELALFRDHWRSRYSLVANSADLGAIIDLRTPVEVHEKEHRDNENAGELPIATDPIIIYGAPRSGTTYLRAVLSEHPNVFISQETRIFTWARQILDDLNDERYFLNHREEFRKLLTPRLRELIYEFYRKLGRGSFYWGDKNPHYCEHPVQLHSILQLFESARFIHIIRDPRDVVASLLSKGWVDFAGAHRVATKFVEVGATFGEKLPASQYCEIRYEELFSDGAAVAARVLEFLGIPIAEEVAAYCARQTAARSPLSGPTRDSALLNAGGSQWEVLLDEQERAESMKLLAPHLRRWGYEEA